MGKPRPANGTAVPTPLTERRGESPSRRPHGDGRSAQTGELPGGNRVFRLLFEKNPLPMWVFDLESLRFLDVNDAAVQKYGYSRSEFLAMTLRDIGPKEDVPRLREALGSLKPTDRMIGIWRNRKKAGTGFDAEVLSTEVTILTRRARLALLNDVTERLRGDRHRATEIGVTRVLIDAKSFAETAPQAIAAICQAEEWALGEVWLYD